MFWAAIISWREDVRRKAEFERAMRAHGESLLRVAKVYAAAGAMREDLEQEIALGVWEALPGWEQSASLKTFLFRVAHNRCIDVMREVRPETPSTEHVERQVTSAASPASQAESRQLLGEVEVCVRFAGMLWQLRHKREVLEDEVHRLKGWREAFLGQHDWPA